MPPTTKSITCCYCNADTLIDLRNAGRALLTCDACGARLSSARMQAIVNKPKPLVPGHGARQVANRPLDPRWLDKSVAEVNKPKKKKKQKKRKGFFDRLEDIWDEIEDVFD